jgi:hypothetical protein
MVANYLEKSIRITAITNSPAIEQHVISDINKEIYVYRSQK